MTKEELLKEGFDEVDMAMGDVWDFDENPIARGVYMMMQEEVGANKSNMYHFIDDKGDAFSVWGSKIIDDAFKMIEPNETVAIMYNGKQKTKDGSRSYKDYSVFHKMVAGAAEKVKTAGGSDGKSEAKVEDMPF